MKDAEIQTEGYSPTSERPLVLRRTAPASWPLVLAGPGRADGTACPPCSAPAAGPWTAPRHPRRLPGRLPCARRRVPVPACAVPRHRGNGGRLPSTVDREQPAPSRPTVPHEE